MSTKEISSIAARAVKKRGGLRSTPSIKPIYPILGIIPGILLIIIFGLFPAFLNLAMSLTNYNGDWATTLFVGADNYITTFTLIGKEVFTALCVTIKFGLLTVIPSQVLGLGTALLVNAKIRGRNFFRALFYMPNILGAIVVCFLWKLMYDTEWGPLIKVAGAVGFDTAFLGDTRYSLVFVSIISIWSSFGFCMTIYLAGLQGISRDYYEAADIDGASPWKKFRNITLPLLRPAVVICLWAAISGVFGAADVIMLTTGGRYGTETMAFYIFRSVFYGYNTQGQNAAVIFYYFIFVTIVMLLFNKFIRKKEVEL